jgi:hypothetical protein
MALMHVASSRSSEQSWPHKPKSIKYNQLNGAQRIKNAPKNIWAKDTRATSTVGSARDAFAQLASTGVRECLFFNTIGRPNACPSARLLGPARSSVLFDLAQSLGTTKIL